MNNMEIQREAIIEIVGTQYEGRAANHQPLFLKQDLILKHQSDNSHDRNAVLLLTADGKELGYLPKGYASIYAPAIDSGRYSFTVEIVKSESDPERPILIVKITSELKNHSEEEIERDILAFVQNIVNGHAQRTKDYLKFIYSEAVNVDELLSVLNEVRLIQKLHSCSNDIIMNCNIRQTSDIYTPMTKESLTKSLSSLKADVNDVLKKIQKAYNDSFDIDDEEEYQRVQGEIREKRKRFRSYDAFLSSSLDAIEGYITISIHTRSSDAEVSDTEMQKDVFAQNDTVSVKEPSTPEIPTVPTMITPEPTVLDKPLLTEQKFFDWLTSDGGVSDITAKQYISNIHSIEKLYQTIYGVRKNILGADSADSVKAMIETLLQRSEYINANEQRHNSFNIVLNKFAQFADIYVDGLKNITEKKNYQSPINPSEPFAIKTVDFDDPGSCTYYKPCSFLLNDRKYSVESWRELYTKFLKLLYNDNAYAGILKRLIGKPLYGRQIDFADKTLSHKLRRAIMVSYDFFAEGNLSTIQIIKSIKYLMDRCSIDDSHMIIEYNTQDTQISLSDITTGNDEIQINRNEISTVNTNSDPSLIVTVQSFEKWLTIYGSIAETDIKKYIRSIHYIENLFHSMLGVDDPLFGAVDRKKTESLLNTLIHKQEYIQDNLIEHHWLSAALAKYIQFTGLTVDVSEDPKDLTVDVITDKNNVSCDSLDKQVISDEQAAEASSISYDKDASETQLTSTASDPNTSKPFVLKDAIIEILSSDSHKIAKYYEYKDGISSKNLHKLIKKNYGRIIGLFEISKLLMTDKTFQTVGKGCYKLNGDMIPRNDEGKYTEPIPAAEETSFTVGPEEQNAAAAYTSVSYESRTDNSAILPDKNEPTIEQILEVIKENSGDLQYEYGFGAYEVKILLSHKGINNASEKQIEALMSECPELQEIEEGYYSLAEENISGKTAAVTFAAADIPEAIESVTPDTSRQEPQETDNDPRHIVINLNGNVVRAYDYSDALNKICEFSINCSPFKMARIAGEGIQIRGNSVFYRRAVPVNGYNRLSNGLQIITVNSLSDLQTITAEVKKYCRIDDGMITIISR